MIEREIEISCETSDLRIDTYLSEVIGKSRSFCSKIIKKGLVLVNNKTVKPSYNVNLGDEILVKIPQEEKLDLKPANIPLNIIYENQYYLIINKPAGLCVHPAPGNFDNTLVNALLYHFQINDDNDVRPGIVHRLDKDTSGLILVAKNRDVREKMSEMFKEREVDKKYLAICYGNPKWDEILVENSIGRHPVDRKKMAVVENGRYAKTKITVLKRYDNIFLADVKIYTGRTHQIRVHCSYLGCPIIGDKVYGNKLSNKIRFERQALHAYYLAFDCPFTKEKKIFEIDMSEDMKAFLGSLNTNS
ncbi:RluA family pseudouridine synthase [Deferribacter desulfuricans]|uniref:RluA family pseudouridine synthase n=1 Tax=Deferribacter desulfuricans TaxID=197162 RepID=UPI00030B2414|nr:RluA family pseudouridine synthase [Deferribacter desulfuricans]